MNSAQRKNIVFLFVCIILFFLPAGMQAHGVDLTGFPTKDVALIYLDLGFTHIIPLGLDHILFVLCLFFLSPKLKTVIWQATAFTVAHSITLGLAMYEVITPPAYIVEPVIALSIMFIAVENMISDQLRPSRVLVVFAFGLIHGMGFASVLTDLGLPRDKFLISLVTFNVGVELGQITVIFGAWLLVGYWFGTKPWYRKRVIMPVSAVIAAIALYWTIERIFFPS